METRKTTITLPVKLWEALRIRAAEEHTTMSNLITEALEAHQRLGLAPARRPATLESFLDAAPEVVASWVAGVGDESEDFDDADVD